MSFAIPANAHTFTGMIGFYDDYIHKIPNNISPDEFNKFAGNDNSVGDICKYFVYVDGFTSDDLIKCGEISARVGTKIRDIIKKSSSGGN